jgi:toxin FitB
LIVLDSSGWLEYFADGPLAGEFAAYLKKPHEVFTSTVAVYEVYKWLKRERSEESAMHAVAAMKTTQIVEISEEIALTAADFSLAHGLAMADATMLATARKFGARLITTDTAFEGIADVVVPVKRKSAVA